MPALHLACMRAVAGIEVERMIVVEVKKMTVYVVKVKMMSELLRSNV